MKKLLFLLIFLLSISLVNAAVSKDTAEVKLTKINAQPQIVEVTFSQPVVAGKSAYCQAKVLDDNDVEVEKTWVVNGKVMAKGDSFSDFKKGDEVECRVTASDSEFTVQKCNSVEAAAAPLAITGMVTGSGGQGGIIALLSLLIVLLASRLFLSLKPVKNILK